MRNYELVIVLDGKATSAKKKTVTEKLEKMVTSLKGKFGEVKDWGVKELAYKIGKSDSGAYLLIQTEMNGAGAKEISNKLRLENDIIRYLLVTKK
jgi:small subunit ribosomal protein S6